jgi:tetratricopeptide (TPR) repeat protein
VAVLVTATGCRPHGREALQRGDQLLEAHKPAEAIPLLEVAATDLPGDAQVWNFLGLAYHAVGRRPDALKAYLMALRQDRNLFEAHFNLGSLYFEDGNWAEAERSLRVFLGVEANRTRADAWNLLGQCEAQLRKPEDAERSFTTALKLEPNRADLWTQLGLVQVSRRRVPAARQSFQTALKLDPSHAPARLNLAVLSQQTGDKAGALQGYRAYLELAPKAANAAEVRALVHQLEGGLPRPVVATNVLVTPPPAVPQAASVGMSNAAVRAAAPVRPATLPGRLAPNTSVVTTSAPPPTVVTPPAPRPTVESSTSRVVSAPVTNPPAPSRPVPEVKPEIVPVEEGPRLQAARDGVRAAAPAPAVPAPASPAATAVVTPPPTEAPIATAAASKPTAVSLPVAGPATAADKDNSDPSKKPGFWGKVNPVRWGNPVKWFKADAKPEKAVTPLTAAPRPAVVRPTNVVVAPPPVVVRSNPPAAAPVVTFPPPAAPVVPRYAPRGPASFALGDRASAEAQFTAALAAYDRKDLAGALALYQRATELDPTFFPARHNLGWTALESGDLSRALLAGEAVVQLDASSAPAQRLFAAALLRAKYPADAAQHLERLIQLEPNDAAAHFTLAGVYASQLGQPAKARSQYLRTLELSPKHPQEAAIRVWLANHP